MGPLSRVSYFYDPEIGNYHFGLGEFGDGNDHVLPCICAHRLLCWIVCVGLNDLIDRFTGRVSNVLCLPSPST